MKTPRPLWGAGQAWLAAVGGLDRRRLRAARADYYDYLACMMEGLRGSRTLWDIFEQDARRHGRASPRGRLSRAWALSYPATGGDLYATWFGCFPVGELAMIRAAQASGNEALAATLRDLSKAVQLTRRAASMAMATLWSAMLALGVLAAMILALPLFTVPRLRQVFGMVPDEFHGAYTRALFDFAQSVQSGGGLALAACLAGPAWLLWSLPNLTGRWRAWLDAVPPWAVYRHVNTLRLFALLTVILGQGETPTTQLRSALAVQRPGASAWLRWHIDAMLARIDLGRIGAATFGGGLLDREMFWFLDDMAQARGLAAGLALTCRRLETRVLRDVARQATALRYYLLLACVAGALGLGLWHYAVIDELRRSLMIFYASQ